MHVRIPSLSPMALGLGLVLGSFGCQRPEPQPAPAIEDLAPETPDLEGEPLPASAVEGSADSEGSHFGRAEDWVARFEGPARDAWQKPDEVVALLEIEPGMTLADLGAGTGYFVQRLSRATGEAGHVLALDVEPDMVRHLDERAERDYLLNVSAALVPPDDPKLAPGTIDRVLTVNTWHHISDRIPYAKKIAEALSPRGTFTIVDFTLESPTGPPPEERLSPKTAIEELRAAGFQCEVLPEELPSQYVIRARRP